jgi:trans-aconitate 2-methyltransferase
MKEGYLRTFDPIREDYVFFETHSTEAENDLQAYACHLRGIGGQDGRIRMLDFGGGTGSFTRSFLQRAGWDRAKLELTVVEPGEKAREEALETLRELTDHPIVHFPTLPTDLRTGFDLVLANHVLYYVPDLARTIAQLSRCCEPNGKVLTAMAGNENTMVQCWAAGFGLVGEPIPYHLAEDLRAVLETMGLAYRREKVSFTIAFPDSSENRTKMLRFLFGDQLARLPQASLLQFFDAYAEGGWIRMDTGHDLFVVACSNELVEAI